MSAILALLGSVLKPVIKEVLDNAVFPAILAAEAKLPSPPVESAVVAVQAAVDSYLDSLLS